MECDGARGMIVDTFLTAPGGRAPTKEVSRVVREHCQPDQGRLPHGLRPPRGVPAGPAPRSHAVARAHLRTRPPRGRDRSAHRDRLPRGGRASEGIGQGGHRRVRRARRRGLPRRVRPVHHRQLRADTRRDRAPLRSAGDQRHRIRSVVGTVDVLTADGIARRRAGLLGRADGQRRVSDRRRAGRALAHRAHLHHQLPRRVRTGGDPDRRRADDPPDRAGHHGGSDEAPRGPTRRASCTAASASAWR